MNLDGIKDEIINLLDKEVIIKVSGSRNKKSMFKGILNNVYSNIFTVLIDGNVKSFTYSDVAIGDVKIYQS